MKSETSFDQVDELARWLQALADPGGMWEAADYPVQAHYRREAQRKLQQAEMLRLDAESAR